LNGQTSYQVPSEAQAALEVREFNVSNKKIKVRVGDTVKSYSNGQNGVVLSLFKGLNGEPLVAIDYGISWGDKGILVEKEERVCLAFEYLIDYLIKEGLNREQAMFFAPSLYQSLDEEADLIKIKKYLSLE
jgi:hypothetical protein